MTGVNKDKTAQVLLSLPRELLLVIDDYKKNGNYDSRSQAMRVLLQKGLKG